MTILARDFADHLTVVPSVAGLHVTALAPSSSVKKISSAVRKAADLGVTVQELSHFAVDSPPRSGLVIGYGAIPTERIQEGMRRLQRCLTCD